MTDVRNLLKKMAAQEAAFAETPFVAPCVRGGRVRARVGGLVQTFATDPADFEGWGLFQAKDGKAAVVEEADLPLVAGYMKNFPLLRLRLARQLVGQTWLAYPASESDMKQRFGAARPVAVYLVTEGAAFEMVTARHVGGGWWFEEVDRRADPVPADLLRDALNAVTEPEAVQFKGLTPEMRVVYDLVTQADERFAARRREQMEEQRRRAEEQYRRDHGYEWYVEAHRDEYEAAWRAEQAAEVEAEADAWVAQQQEQGRGRRRRGRNADANAPRNMGGNRGGDEGRLREALRTSGGEMRDFRDRGEYWLVEWTTADGHRHTSAIAKGDLTVISSGICLSGRDRDFDLQSLVGVIEGRDW